MESWKLQGYTWSFVWCGVGSREVPSEVIPIIEWVGQCLALLGGVLSTGDAIGSDFHFKEGYDKGRLPGMPPAQVYYTVRKNKRGLVHDPSLGCHEAEQYPTFESAQQIAYNARGSFEGLFPSGIALHTRNAFQVLSETLEHPRWLTVLYAKPVGKQGRVSGGTNTALQIAKMYNVKTVNLYDEETRLKFIDWIKEQLTKRNITIPPIE